MSTLKGEDEDTLEPNGEKFRPIDVVKKDLFRVSGMLSSNPGIYVGLKVWLHMPMICP